MLPSAGSSESPCGSASCVEKEKEDAEPDSPSIRRSSRITLLAKYLFTRQVVMGSA